MNIIKSSSWLQVRVEVSMWYIIEKLFTSVLVKVVDIYLYFGEQLLTNVIKNVVALLIDQDVVLFHFDSPQA